jgi:DNA polymerase-4
MSWVMHVDMDAFFASVEQKDNPQYQGKPLIVGGNSNRGVVATCSYEARKYGVHSAMSIVKARQLCPQGIFIPGRYWRYEEVSEQIMSIFREFSPCIEPLSIDEAFLDLKGMEKLVPDIPSLGSKVKARIKEVTGLTASVGLAPNKFLAKLASDLRKPDGLVIIRQEEAAAFIAPLPISRVFGIGEKTQEALQRIGINTIGQMAACQVEYLQTVLGNRAQEVHDLALGLDDRPVESDLERKSIGKEETFEEDIYDHQEQLDMLWDLCQQVGWRLRMGKKAGATVTLKIKYDDFHTITRSATGQDPLNLDEDIFRIIKELHSKVTSRQPVRLLGVSVGKLFTEEENAPGLFTDPKREKQTAVIDALKNRFGENIIHKGKN